MIQKYSDPLNSVRIDKWLWCARFYKTRGAAGSAIKSGKVSVNNEKTKPSKVVQIGDFINIRQGPYSFKITIKSLSKTRKSAREASLLYEELEESIQQRETIAKQIKADTANYPGTKGRPGKRERRELIKFKESKYMG